ncbi:MAG TPA: hypothetical protein VM487_25710 [Phycisphaerae bacterium]|nr:hypothetical protein [Phycisphaerae bacterium]
MPRIRKRYVLAVLPLLLPMGFYCACVDRAHVHTQQDGWDAHFSYVRLACHVCTGRVHWLSCNGRPVPVPRLFEDPTRNDCLTLYTPVGMFETWSRENSYHLYIEGSLLKPASRPTITPEELERGYYDVPIGEGYADPLDQRKQGTPGHWCLAYTHNHCRWLDPILIDDLTW